MNTTMIVTLLGAASDAPSSRARSVSGVGGQYNFVAMSHALPTRLVMMLRATHDNKDGLSSSIVWNYGHVTIPRHLRDVVVTEYGIAELRGQPTARSSRGCSRSPTRASRTSSSARPRRTANSPRTTRSPSATATTAAGARKRSFTRGPRPGCCPTFRSAPT